MIERLPAAVEATLLACPPGVEPRIVMLLAALLAPRRPHLSDLDAAFVDIPQLAAKLAREGFDGTVRFERGAQRGFVLFSKGKRVLDVFGSGWPRDPTSVRWEQWLASTGATVSVEERRSSFPSVTYRRKLCELRLQVVRAAPAQDGGIRTDARAAAEALRLCPQTTTAPDLPSESTIQSLVEADPIVGVARWLLVDAGDQFEQFRRTSRWRAILEPLEAVDSVTLHHTMAGGDGRNVTFDGATFAEDGRAFHVMERVAVGSPEAVTSFIARLLAAKEAEGPSSELAGGVLVAPSFSDEALETYLETLRASRKGSLRSAVELLTHREGHLTTRRGGCHVLLVEEAEGRRRPLVPQD